MAAMSSRALTALGVLAAAVAVAAAAALALALADSGRGGAPTPGKTVVVDLDRQQRPPASPGSRPQRQASADLAGSAARASAPAGSSPVPEASTASPPVPALTERPASGPAFAIARLRPGARLGLWSEPGGNRLETVGPRTEFGSPVVFSVAKSRGRWLGVETADVPDGQLGWIRRDPRQVDLYWTKYSLHADLSGLSLSLRYGKATIARFLVTVGAPGSETPVGRYGITDALSFDESPFYGCCALALSGRQTQLPEGWIGGDRLAIHGTPGPVGGAESHGCIRATDATMRELFRRVPLGAPVFVDE
jgi:hypothetical protein